MARLTILQASQQGFGSTLTIHRHIKDGSLPIYEEGDVKLLEVDDLIYLFGEPGVPDNDNQSSGETTEIDIYEYNRMKSELDQKTKKNMWLAADLADAVKDLREKEANFHAERERLLNILEQAQALLLREAKRAGAGLKKKDVSAPNTEQSAATPDTANIEQETPSANPQPDPLAAMAIPAEGEAPLPEPVSDSEMSIADMLEQKRGSRAQASESLLSDGDMDEPSPDILKGAKSNAPPIILDEEERQKRRGNAANPLIPPLEDDDEAPTKSRLMGTMAWLLLFSVVGCGLVFLKYKPQIMTSIEEIMRVLGAA